MSLLIYGWCLKNREKMSLLICLVFGLLKRRRVCCSSHGEKMSMLKNINRVCDIQNA